jgi:hypothetical protein
LTDAAGEQRNLLAVVAGQAAFSIAACFAPRASCFVIDCLFGGRNHGGTGLSFLTSAWQIYF